LNEFYERSENYKYWAEHIYPRSSQARRERLFRPRATFAAEIAGRSGIRNGRLLEVGAGYGWFCEEAAATGAFGRIIGMEPTPHLANVCRQRGIEVVESPYEAYAPKEGFDFVASFEVIEHLHDPGKFVAWCARILNPGGILLLTCPNIAGFETTCLGSASGTIDHQHINLFSPRSIEELLRRHGFGTIEIDTPGELDVEIVREALQNSAVTSDQVGAFVARLLIEGSVDTRQSFQAFLKSSGNSSHMRIVARRPSGS
jgi:2-polyprenyl-3-methyl-5-hydroxy-6-metoxy-1,4-benzoquinol methylase